MEGLFIKEYNEALKKSYEKIFSKITGKRQALPPCESKNPAIVLQWKEDIIKKFLKNLEKKLTTNHNILEEINNCYKSQKQLLESLGEVSYLPSNLVFLYLTTKEQRKNDY